MQPSPHNRAQQRPPIGMVAARLAPLLAAVLAGRTFGAPERVATTAQNADDADVEYLLKVDEDKAWRVTQVFSDMLFLGTIRIETTPAGDAESFSRAAVFRHGRLLGFVRLLQPLGSGYALRRIAESVDPSEIRYNDVLKPFELERVAKHTFEELPAETRTAVRTALDKLGSPAYREREEATRYLSERGREVLPLLSKALADRDPEVRMRADEVREKILAREFPVDPSLAAILVRKSGRNKPVTQQGFLGIAIEDVKDGAEPGAMVMEVRDNTPAQKCGLQLQDIILSIDDVVLLDSTDVLELISAKQPGSIVTLKVRRHDRDFELKVELAHRPQALPY